MILGLSHPRCAPYASAAAVRYPQCPDSLTYEAYALDLRQFAGWCQQHHVRLFQARRADIECFARTGPWSSPARAARLSLSRSRRAPPGRSIGPSASAWKGRSSWPLLAVGWTGMAPGGLFAASRAAPGSPSPVGPHTLRHAFITAALDAGVSLWDVQEAASHADPRAT
ncbi:MAG: hypothetical protein ACTHPS_23070 [Streptosporangiaceae bacterium]